MIIFTPNTVIKSTEVNANFDELQIQIDDIFWHEVGRTTLTGTADTISVTGLSTYKYLKVLISVLASGAIIPAIRFNNDSGTNYAYDYIANAVAGSAVTATTISAFWSGSYGGFIEMTICNIATQPKHGTAEGVAGNSTVGTNPDAVDFWWKWVNTTDAITGIYLINLGAGDFAANTQMVILGHN